MLQGLESKKRIKMNETREKRQAEQEQPGEKYN